MRRVEGVVDWQIRDACASDSKPPWPNRSKTAAVVPFYGGALKRQSGDQPELTDAAVDTGNAHSRQPRVLKLKALRANVCALLRAVAASLVVTVCDEMPDDHAGVSNELANMGPELAGRASVRSVACGAAPKNLPFLALAALDDFAPASARFVAFSEADLYWTVEQRAGAALSRFFAAFPRALVTPHRWHKRYGSDPRCGDACATQVTGQNLCYLNPEGARTGARVQAIVRVPGPDV